MRIVFICSNQDISVGSYRIWINDLSETLTEIGESSVIHHPNDKIELTNDDIVILSKGDAQYAVAARKAFPNIKMGVVNLSADLKNLPIDFVIVGSIEEMDSLANYHNVFLYPLIERMFENSPKKIHEANSNFSSLKLCFHGHFPHLTKFNPHLSAAIEEFDRLFCPVELKIITGNPNIKWDFGRPEIDNIVIKKWDFNTIGSDIQSSDVGIVPNVTDYSPQVRGTTNINFGLYDTDYFLRFKNKSNAGRCFVFHQLGIPVIADLTPSNFHIMGDPKNGYLVLSKEGWMRAFRNLTDHDHRDTIAKNAKETFESLYSPHEWARRLVSGLRELLK